MAGSHGGRRRGDSASGQDTPAALQSPDPAATAPHYPHTWRGMLLRAAPEPSGPAVTGPHQPHPWRGVGGYTAPERSGASRRGWLGAFGRSWLRFGRRRAYKRDRPPAICPHSCFDSVRGRCASASPGNPTLPHHRNHHATCRGKCRARLTLPPAVHNGHPCVGVNTEASLFLAITGQSITTIRCFWGSVRAITGQSISKHGASGNQ